MTQNKASSSWNPSVIIALIAVLISCASAFIGLKEARILSEQQDLMAEQKLASVWPFIKTYANQDYQKSDKEVTATYSFFIKNKGVGPAILDSVDYYFSKEKIKPHEIVDKLNEQNPKFKFSMNYHTFIDKNVISAGEETKVVELSVVAKVEEMKEINNILNACEFYLDFCYCSIYGDCWRSNDGIVSNNSSCQPREDIR